MTASVFCPREWSCSSYSALNLVQVDHLAGCDGVGDGSQRAHGSNPVLEIDAMLQGAVQDRIGEAFDLPFIRVGVFSQGTPIDAIFCGETLHVAGLVEPGQKHLALHAAMLAINLEAFLEIPVNRDSEVQVAKSPVGKLNFDEPAISAETFQQPRAQPLYFAG